MLSTLVHAQQLDYKLIKTEALTINDGLSQGMINCMIQDQYGFIWIGTNDGLNRYDGYGFTVFKNDIADRNSIAGNFITALYEDSRGLIWVGTGLNGLSIFDRNNERFIQVSELSNEGMAINRVLSIQEDKDHLVWIGTTNGLFCIDLSVISDKGKTTYIKKNKVSHISFSVAGVNQELFRFHDETTGGFYFEPTLYIDRNNTFWMSTTGGCFRMTRSNGINKLERLPEEFYPGRDTTRAVVHYIYNYLEDTVAGKLYLMRSGYITSVDLNTGKVENIFCRKYHLGFYRSQLEFYDGRVLAASGSKLNSYDLVNSKVTCFQSANSSHTDIINHSNMVFKDKSGMIWIGSKGYGLLKFNPRSEKFHDTNTASIVWMSNMNDGSVLAINNNNLHKIKCKEDKPETDTILNSLYSLHKVRGIDALIQADDGSYYLNAGRLCHVSADLKTLKKIEEAPSPFPIYKDNAGKIWFGINDAFCSIDTKTDEILKYPYPVKSAVLSPYKFLEIIYEDKDVFWLGTTNGLFSFNKTAHTWKHFTRNTTENTSLGSDVVFALCNDPRYPAELIWVGTNGGGLNCLNKKTGKIQIFSLKAGLPNSVVYGILADNKGRLWMSTNKGISCYVPSYKKEEGSWMAEEGVFRNFEVNDGLQSNEFNRYAYSFTNNKWMVFGGVSGLNYFNPDEINVNTTIPKVQITDFKLGNRPVTFNNENPGRDIILKKPVFLTDNITLPYSQNMISFDFAAMDFAAVHRNNFRYKLENFDKTWVDANHNNSATYTNLDPGNYIFRVVAGNSDGVWNNEGAAISLTILPPWYLTWWFRLCLVLVVAGAIYTIYRLRLAQATHLLKVRNSIASDLHDEIGSTLSSVYIYSEVASRSVEGNSEAKEMLDNISREVSSMIEALGDIVWTVNARNDKFENIMNRIRATALELCEAQNYELHTDMDERLNTQKMRMENRRNFYLIYKEAINNIMKYARGRNIWITLRQDHRNHILFIIKDDGCGFNMEKSSDGNGLSNIRKRTLDLNGVITINSQPGKGTEIHLEFPNS